MVGNVVGNNFKAVHLGGIAWSNCCSGVATAFAHNASSFGS
jgi:hypothetical protein